eukprot:TRINITY_DN40209_c0_g1_i1.p1 TRINITY_DN40209_c0_g1~~TRINITY_DN40209_c0_g1_i1.p1  ORF type:complete len:461 (-),score=60.03 TRINITY_DN40209_c0_g1_i1:86-1339(-)
MASQMGTYTPKGGNGQRKSNRQMAGRYRCPWINSQLIAEAGDVNRLLNAIQAYLPHMNLVNISTALHRLAKLVSSSKAAQRAIRHNNVLSELLTAAHAALERAQCSCASPPCQALSNVTWALATLKVVNSDLWHAAAVLAGQVITSFKPFELSSTLWAFAKAGSLDERVQIDSHSFFLSAAAHLRQHGQDLTFRCVIMTVWAFACHGMHDVALFKAAADRLVDPIGDASCQELCDTTWAFGTAGVLHEELFNAITQACLQRLGDFAPRQLSDVLHAFYSVGFNPKELAEAAASLNNPKKMQRGLSESTAASSSDSGDAREDASFDRTPSTRSVAKVLTSGGSLTGEDWVCSVKNTFLHVETASNASTCSDDCVAPTVKPLPECLDFIPFDSVSRDWLEAYRQDYQRFRRGLPATRAN